MVTSSVFKLYIFAFLGVAFPLKKLNGFSGGFYLRPFGPYILEKGLWGIIFLKVS